MDSRDLHVIVIGGSLAGAAAAVVLGRAAVPVTVVDKSEFPRRKPCGEGLCSLGIRSLEALGVYLSKDKGAIWPYKAYEVFSRGREFRIEAPWGGVGIQRFDLDSLVLERARAFSSVTIVTGERAAVTPDLQVVIGGQRVSASHILVADGAGSKVAHSLEAIERRYGRALNAASAMYRGRFSYDGDSIMVTVGDGFELYATRVGEELLNLSVLADTPRTGRGGDAQVALRAFFIDRPETKEIFGRLGFSGDLVTPVEGRAHIGNVRRELRSDKVILVGDAREEFDPCGGMGMTHAVMSGVSAAESILRCISGASHAEAARWREVKERSFANPMRTFTKITKGGLTTAKKFPWMLGIINNSVVRKTLLALTKGL